MFFFSSIAEKQQFLGTVFPLELAVILGGVFLIPYLFFGGMKGKIIYRMPITFIIIKLVMKFL